MIWIGLSVDLVLRNSVHVADENKDDDPQDSGDDEFSANEAGEMKPPRGHTENLPLFTYESPMNRISSGNLRCDRSSARYNLHPPQRIPRGTISIYAQA